MGLPVSAQPCPAATLCRSRRLASFAHQTPRLRQHGCPRVSDSRSSHAGYA